MNCVRCGSSEQIEEHHIVELSNGGSDEAYNKEFRCRPCHKYEHAVRLIRASLYFERKRDNNKERIAVYERRLKALARLNTPQLIRRRGTYLSYWGDTSLHRLPRRVRSKTEEMIDNRINLILTQATRKEG